MCIIGVAGFYILQYKAHVLAVQEPCTRSTEPMYLQYKAFVLMSQMKYIGVGWCVCSVFCLYL